MEIDTEHLHYWMQAIRQSKDPMRTMDAFWRGQIASKEWLIDTLRDNKKHYPDWPTIDIHGGWVGTLASLLFQSGLFIESITSIDIDPECEKIAVTMNQLEANIGRFKAVTADMCSYTTYANIIINTSCEHLSQEQYNTWLNKVPKTSLLVLQSNNYKIPEHVRPAETLEDFKVQSGIDIIWAGELELPLYKRWMILGRKHNVS